MTAYSDREILQLANGKIAFTHLSLMLLYRCNFRCRDCLIGGELDNPVQLTFDDAIRIIEDIASLRTIHVIGFVGGEPFIAYKTMLRIAEYVHSHYGSGLTVSTNSSWATSYEKASRMLAPLKSFGLEWALLSWDDYHAEFAPIERLINAIRACQALDIEVTLQNIVSLNGTRNTAFRRKLAAHVDTDKITWVENAVVPVGLGEDVAETDRFLLQQLPAGGCNAGKILTVRPDGSTRPCCGAALMNPQLNLGNIKDEGASAVVERASWNPVINSLIANSGPRGLMNTLNDLGRADLVPTKFGDPCDACNQILNNREARTLLSGYFKGREHWLAAQRLITENLEACAEADLRKMPHEAWIDERDGQQTGRTVSAS